MLPRVTVLMTVYNGEKYLKECMDSVLNQTFKDFEFLILDDCSTDSSVDIIKSYNDTRIRLIENRENLGQVKSLNIGLDYARGEYVARMDQDDLMLKARLEKQLDFMQRSPDVCVVGTWGKAIDEKGRRFAKYCFPVRYEEIIGSILCGRHFFMHIAALFRKDTVIDAGKYNESFSLAEDYELWTRLLLKKYKLVNIPEYLVKFRYHSENSSRKFPEIQLKSFCTATSNFLKIISGTYCDPSLDRLCNFLVNARLMKKEYWLDEMEPSYLEETIDLLDAVLKRTTSYFNFTKREIFLMKKVFYNTMLNFAYMAADKGKSLPLYLLCLRNYPYLFTRPKMYLCPIKALI